MNTTTEIWRFYLWHELYADFCQDSLSATAEKIGLSQTRFLTETWFVSLRISATLLSCIGLTGAVHPFQPEPNAPQQEIWPCANRYGPIESFNR